MEETMKSPPWSLPSISITQPLPQTLLFFISKFHYLIPIKLTDHNYPIWKLQCEGALKATSLFDYIQQSQPPSPTILDSTGKTIANPMFFPWFVVETHLRSCLIATLTPDVLTLVRHTSSARDLWVFLKRKFEKSNSFEEFDLQDSSPVICQICGNEGHGALDCSYRYVEDSQPANSTMASGSYADEVFDGSPDRNADGSAVSAAITGSDIVTPRQGMAVLFEPEMWVLNHSDSSLVEDRLALSPEEMIGCQTRQEIVNFELFQKKPEPQISEAKEKVILMAKTTEVSVTRNDAEPGKLIQEIAAAAETGKPESRNHRSVPNEGELDCKTTEAVATEKVILSANLNPDQTEKTEVVTAEIETNEENNGEQKHGNIQMENEADLRANLKYMCKMCVVKCIGEANWNAHVVGRKHQGKICEMTKMAKGNYLCSYCDVDCKSWSNFGSHLNGKKHLSNIQEVLSG